MQKFSPSVPKVPYLYRQAVNAGVPIMVKQANGGGRGLLDLKKPVNYRDEYIVERSDEDRVRNLKETIERTTKFVCGGDVSFRVNKDILRGDILTVDDEYFFLVGAKDTVTQVDPKTLTTSEKMDAYPVFEVFDVNHNIAVGA